MCSDDEPYVKLPEDINIPTLERIKEASLEDINAALKIIGEISPGATWVKDGNEFDEEEWQVWVCAGVTS